jgi:hypothetical protein
MFLDFFVDDSLLKKEARKCYLVKLFIKNKTKNIKQKE